MPLPYLPNYFDRVSDDALLRLARYLGIDGADKMTRDGLREAIELVKWRTERCGESRGYNG